MMGFIVVQDFPESAFRQRCHREVACLKFSNLAACTGPSFWPEDGRTLGEMSSYVPMIRRNQAIVTSSTGG
jgi:hypothetical protein